MALTRPVQVIAVTGGKGGVGKTNVSVNTAIALAKMGRRVTVLDADLGLANVDVLLGLKPSLTLADVLEGRCSLVDIQLTGPEGVKIIPASSGVQRLVNLSTREHAGIITAFSELSDQIDVLIVDTAAGISESVTSFVQAAQQVVVVINDEPTSITDAYALIKLLNREYGVHRFHMVANMVRTPQEGRQLYLKLLSVTDRFLEIALQYLGAVPIDEHVRKSVQRQKAVLEAYPRSPAALALKGIAQKVDQFPLPTGSRGQLEFFAESLLAVGAGS